MKDKIKTRRIIGITLEGYENGQLYLTIRRQGWKAHQYEDTTPARTQRILDLYYKWITAYYQDWSV